MYTAQANGKWDLQQLMLVFNMSASVTEGIIALYPLVCVHKLNTILCTLYLVHVHVHVLHVPTCTCIYTCTCKYVCLHVYSIMHVYADKGFQFQAFSTNKSDHFSRTFKNDQYFYCKNCKTYEFGHNNETTCGMNCQTPCIGFNGTEYCSSVHMKKSVIYVGGDPAKAKSKFSCQRTFQSAEHSMAVCYYTCTLYVLVSAVFWWFYIYTRLLYR